MPYFVAKLYLTKLIENRMKKTLLLIAIMTGLASGAWLFANYHSKATAMRYNPSRFVPDATAQAKIDKKKAKKAKQVGSINGYAEHMKQLKANQITGELPLKAVLEARQDILNMQVFKEDCPAPAQNLEWQFMGPNDTGGRTRTLLIDKDNSSKLYAGGVSGGLFVSMNGGNSWTQHPQSDEFLSSSITSIAQASNGNIYIGTGEYVQSSGYGEPNSQMPGAGVYRSTDGGATFHLLPGTIPGTSNYPFTDWAFVSMIAIHPAYSDLVYVATSQGVFMSADSGDTWGRPDGLTSTSYAYDVRTTDNGTIYVLLSNALYRSTDGYTFQNITNAPGLTLNGAKKRLAVHHEGNYLYIATSTGGCMDKVFQSKDAGATWDIIGQGESTFFNVCGDYCQCWYDLALGVNPNNPEHIYLGGIDLWSWRNDWGWNQLASWFLSEGNEYYVHADQHEVVFDRNNPNTVYFLNDGGVFKTNEAHLASPKFKMLNKNYNVTQFYSVAAGYDGAMLGGTQDNGTRYIHYDYNSLQATQEVYGGDGGYTEISDINPLILFTEYVNGDMKRSGSGGDGFGGFFDGNIDGNADGAIDGGAPFITSFFLWEDLFAYFVLPGTGQEPVKRAKFITGGNSGKLWCTDNPLELASAPDWRVISSMGSGQALADAAFTSDGNTVFVSTRNGKVIKVSGLDAPTTTSKTLTFSGFTGRYVTGVALDEYNPDVLVVTCGNYGNNNYIYISDNVNSSSPTFTSLQSNLPKIPIYDVVTNPENPEHYIIIGTEFGIWSYSQTTQCWTQFNEGIGYVPVYALRFEYMRDLSCKVLYAGTHGRGMFRSTSFTSSFCDTSITFGGSTSTEQSTSSGSIMRLYPNPANDQVNFVATLPNGVTTATLVIYSPNGAIVKQQNLSTNNPQLQTTISVSDLPAGSYMAVLQTNKGKKTQKMVVMH